MGHTEKQKPYVNDIVEMIKKRQLARDYKDMEEECRWNKPIKYTIKKNKRRYWAAQLEKEDWKEIESTNKGVMPKHTKVENDKGVFLTSKERSDVLADYFEQK